MNRFINMLSRISGVFGGIAAIYLLCVTRPSADLTIDDMGVIIGILAILVTLLVAWNIYNAIGVEQRMKDVQQHQEDRQSEQERRFEDFRQEIDSKIKSIQTFTSAQASIINGNKENVNYAYISLFNALQGQIMIINEDKGYLQIYSHFQTALNALLKCKDFPSDIRHNIKVLLKMMKENLNKIPDDAKTMEEVFYKLNDEDRNEFIQNMEEISKSSRVEFSFEDRQLFMEIASKAKVIFENHS